MASPACHRDGPSQNWSRWSPNLQDCWSESPRRSWSPDGLPCGPCWGTSPRSQQSCSWTQKAGSLGVSPGCYWRGCSVYLALERKTVIPFTVSWDDSAISKWHSHGDIYPQLFDAHKQNWANWRKCDVCAQSRVLSICQEAMLNCVLKCASSFGFRESGRAKWIKLSVLNLQTSKKDGTQNSVSKIST